MSTPPVNAYEILVEGQKWNWSFTYGGGEQDSLLTVPVDTPISLVLTSEDVIHSLSIPDFRVKMDCVPGRYTYAWFQAVDAGDYDLYAQRLFANARVRGAPMLIAGGPGDQRFAPSAMSFGTAWLERRPGRHGGRGEPWRRRSG